jgi:hypothetical protein
MKAFRLIAFPLSFLVLAAASVGNAGALVPLEAGQFSTLTSGEKISVLGGITQIASESDTKNSRRGARVKANGDITLGYFETGDRATGGQLINIGFTGTEGTTDHRDAAVTQGHSSCNSPSGFPPFNLQATLTVAEDSTGNLGTADLNSSHRYNWDTTDANATDSSTAATMDTITKSVSSSGTYYLRSRGYWKRMVDMTVKDLAKQTGAQRRSKWVCTGGGFSMTCTNTECGVAAREGE